MEIQVKDFLTGLGLPKPTRRLTMINNVLNPCSYCGKAMPKGKEIYVSCQELGFTHGRECDCGLPVGSGCYRKIKAMNRAGKYREYGE